MKTAKPAQESTFLVGDIGGTRTRLAMYAEGRRSPLAEAVFSSQEHATFEEVAARFLVEAGATAPEAAVFGIAGPVKNRVARVTNLPWVLDERIIARRLKIRNVRLFNDLVVGARGSLEVPTKAVVNLTPTRPARRGLNIGVIAAGTGLGEARLVWTGDRYLPLPTEGGHCDFAPRTPLEIELWKFLHQRFPDHISSERVISGSGLGLLYDFFAARGGRESRAVAERLATGDRNAAIAELGLEGKHRPAAQAVDLFATLYGAEAGNLALRELALGGIYVLGNIARVIVTERRDLFVSAFCAKGRFAELLADIPISVVTDPLVGVRGALALAREVMSTVS